MQYERDRKQSFDPFNQLVSTVGLQGVFDSISCGHGGNGDNLQGKSGAAF